MADYASTNPNKLTMRILLTGGAGFIGSHLVDRLLAEGAEVTVVDNLDPFYEPAVKLHNISAHIDNPGFAFVRGDICRVAEFGEQIPDPIDVIVHLAARAGVRPSIADPTGYQHVNVAGTQSMLELAKERGVRHFVFASSSSVYGVNPNVPWSESEMTLRPISPYASTKVSGELLGHVYSHLYGIRFTALRFFTVYGPRQRPDLAIHKFSRLMLAGQPIPLFGDGSTERDYTHALDVIDGIRSAIDYDDELFDVFNIGSDEPVSLSTLVDLLQDVLGVEAKIDRHPEQPGDLPRTWSDLDHARERLGYQPRVDLRHGLATFADWIKRA
jgi:UDP-glucuronate 4-epimerase